METVKRTAAAVGVGGAIGGAVSLPIAITVTGAPSFFLFFSNGATETALPAWFATGYGASVYTSVAVSGASIAGGQ